MTLSNKIQNRRVEKAIKPVHEKLSLYRDALYALQGLIDQKADFSSVSNAIAELPMPTDFLPNALRVKKAKPHPLPARRKARRDLFLATGYLNTLHARLLAEDCERQVKTAGVCALDLHVRYCIDCVSAMMKCVNPRSLRSHGVTAGQSMMILTRKLAARANDFRVLSKSAVEAFDEAAYVALNPDVAAAIESGSIGSGYEHFVRSGLREAQSGPRDAAGFDVYSITFAEKSKFDTPAVKMLRDVIKSSGDFDELFYRISCPHHLSHTQNALDHYVTVGEGLGCSPNERFDASWYRKNYALTDSMPSAFGHYLAIGQQARLKPNAVMDPVYYAARYSQLFNSTTDSVSHYYEVGFSQQLRPSAEFNAEQYVQNEMSAGDVSNPITHFRRSAFSNDAASYGDPDISLIGNLISPTLAMAESQAAAFGNPYESTISKNSSTWGKSVRATHQFAISSKSALHRAANRTLAHGKHQSKRSWQAVRRKGGVFKALALGHASTSVNRVSTAAPAVNVASQIKYFANPGPAFEEQSKLDTSLESAKAKTIAFFLPQFYAFEQNDEWWGKGFTEWRNVSRGAPRFENHYQPRIPRDLGFYDLTNADTLKAQSELAKQAGIEAFCFYYYWFNGERLMDKPLDLFVDSDIDQEFCIMWANENWTRTWDGFDGQVLIQQDYRDDDEDAFIADTAKYLNHPRYTRVNGRPLFILYRPGLLPEAESTIARWKRKWEKACGVEPWVLMVQGFGDENPVEYDLDGAVEFPPHKVCANIPDINNSLNVIDPNYAGHARDYNAVIEASLSEPVPDFPLIKTVSPHWDNDARREGRGMTLHGSTPENYERWLNGAVKYARDNPFHGESIVFINAWNEWAEGAYLEPDVHYGHAYLNATQRAVHGLLSDERRQSILLVGHDAHRHGAQLLLKSIAQTCSKQFGMNVFIALKSTGPMLNEYKEIATTVVLDELGEHALIELIHKNNIASAICNTTVTGDLVPVLKKQGVSVVSLIHELPNLITEYGLEKHVKNIAGSADHVVFPARMVEDGFNRFVNQRAYSSSGGNSAQSSAVHHIRPQGNYKAVVFDKAERAQIRNELGVQEHEKLVLNVGYADLRKGFDLFLQAAKQMIAKHDDVHFAWLGNRDKDIDLWLTADLDDELSKRLHLVDFTDNVNAYYSASDALYLSSREDPYPTVVLEAMALGMPVVLHKGATGFDQLVGDFGFCLNSNGISDTVAVLRQALFNDTDEDKRMRAEYVAQACQFDDYCFDLLRWAQPGLKKISVVVPNYNYEQYMSSRLNSVFNQTYPVFETIVLDDCSSDDSVVQIEQVAKMAGRTIRFSPNETNSGNTFKQWKKGMSMVRGDLVWIAEADDWADPEFLTASVSSHGAKTAFSFTDSVQIDTDDKVLAESYFYYYKDVDATLFSQDFSINGDEFVARAMAVKNVVMNVSSVLWNRDVLQHGLEELGGELTSYKLVGDWRLYLQASLMPGCHVAYINQPLNTHRRHAQSVTHALDHELHFAEIQAMHRVVMDALPVNDRVKNGLQTDIDDYVSQLRVQFGLDTIARENDRQAA